MYTVSAVTHQVLPVKLLIKNAFKIAHHKNFTRPHFYITIISTRLWYTGTYAKWISHLDYKFVLSRYDIKSTRFVEQAISATTNVHFMSLTW